MRIFLRRYLIILLLTILLDSISTYILLTRFVGFYESRPFVGWYLDIFGIGVGIFLITILGWGFTLLGIKAVDWSYDVMNIKYRVPFGVTAIILLTALILLKAYIVVGNFGLLLEVLK